MNLERILPFAQNLLVKGVKPADNIVDVTVWKGTRHYFLRRPCFGLFSLR
jgi:hypothetical protein